MLCSWFCPGYGALLTLVPVSAARAAGCRLGSRQPGRDRSFMVTGLILGIAVFRLRPGPAPTFGPGTRGPEA